LFLAPAVKPVLGLINKFGAVGGIRRFAVDAGDFYPVITSDGTYILIRHETGTEQAAQPSTELPPAVADAFVGALRETQQWLWPSRPVTLYGVQIFRLEADKSSQVTRYTIEYPARTEPPGAAATPTISRSQNWVKVNSKRLRPVPNS
jgi:hypothetical protein